ncbi:acyl-coenzyme A diphosphatase FITM2 [Chanos chanos]|uniref:Acyl-coenzyme A diphosphatase FITM2 n=1 Tax=Chanos chanos TaxID=29144 RepID=A0A6J2UUW9_CHACN|nr:fat storage-inducing transmembrane protein 2 [Chanos chanos]
MAALRSIVNNLVRIWRLTHVRQNLPYLFIGISLIGSILKELELVPKTYFSNSKNFLNLYFVKISWGWTIFLLLPFIYLSNSHKRGNAFVLQRLSSLFVATVIWYTCTETFFYIENITGACYETESSESIRGELASKAECKKAGFFWNGYDISGHSFILAYSALVIVEEMTPMLHLRRAVQTQGTEDTILDVLYVMLNAIVAIWIWMFGCTSVYFHDVSHKALGTGCALLCWYFTYKVWYLNQYSPCLPPQYSEQKQHA